MDWFDFLFAADGCFGWSNCACSSTFLLFLLLGLAGGVGGYFLGVWLNGQFGANYLQWVMAAVGALVGMALAYWIQRRYAESRDWS